MAEFYKDPRCESSSRITWPGGKPKDRVELEDDAVLAIIKRFGFSVRTGSNCYEIVNAAGDAVEVPFGDNDWEAACQQLKDACG